MMRMRCWKNQWRQDVLKKWLVTREAQTTLLYQKSTVKTVSLSWVIWLSQVARLLYHFSTKDESGQRSAVSGQRWWWPRLLKLASLVLFAALKNSFFRVRVHVGVFYLNVSKKRTTPPFLFAINHRKSCSKRHLKNIILLNIDLCACVCACVFVF